MFSNHFVSLLNFFLYFSIHLLFKSTTVSLTPSCQPGTVNYVLCILWHTCSINSSIINSINSNLSVSDMTFVNVHYFYMLDGGCIAI